MKTAWMVLVVGLLTYNVEGLEYTCTLNPGEASMTLSVTQEKGAAANQLEAIDLATGQTNGCKSTDVTSGATTVLQLQITVSVPGRTQTSPLLSTANCYVEKDASVGTQVNFNIIQQATAGMSVATDTVYNISCDSASATGSSLSLSGQALTLSITPSTATATNADVTVKLVDASGSDISDSQDLGTVVKLRVIYTYPATATANEYPVGVRTYSVIAAGTSTFASPNAVLITANGCVGTSAEALPFNLADSMTYNSAVSATLTTAAAATNDIVNVYDSGTFELAMFDGPTPKELHIKVNYEAVCLDTANERCANQQKYCTDNGLTRRKRSTNPSQSTNGTLEFYVPINVGSKTTATQSQAGADTGSGGSVVAQNECKVPDMYWIISVVLGFFLLIVMALCVYLALRMRREQQVNRKVIESHGRHNPGYC